MTTLDETPTPDNPDEAVASDPDADDGESVALASEPAAGPSVFLQGADPTAPVPVYGVGSPVTATLEVTCPSCGTVSHFSELRKSAEEFCRRCDYPLFWARRRLGAGEDDGDGGAGLRRLPGAGGWRSEASLACPTCREPNRLDAKLCVRCGGDMHPAPAPVVRPAPPVIEREPEPEPEPEPKRTPWALIVLLALLVAVVVAAVIIAG